IFLEMVMGPTCSVFFEREPVEDSSMLSPPRSRTGGLFAQDELLISIVQGTVIAAGVLSLYYFLMHYGHSLEETRAAVFTTLVLCNLLLTFTNRSFTENFTRTLRYKNNLAPGIPTISLLRRGLMHFVPAIKALFGFATLGADGWLWCLGIALTSVLWFEIYKTNLSDTR
ncbi:MAG: cation transporting ATPase C-terminal domain-containing protein, partial [Bacteroidetes bacterium]|nr:cation transporting ATPase C-terminal domain-containing protein [Bacteroidota bacterium]